MIRFVIFSLRRAWQGFWRNALMSLAATATMILMLTLLAGFWIIQTGLNASLTYVEQKVEVVAYLEEPANVAAEGPFVARVRGVMDGLLAMPEVADVAYVSKAAALERFRASLRERGDEDLTSHLDANPLPASLEVKLVEADSYGEVVDYLRAQEGVVEKVEDVQSTVEGVVTITNVLRTAGVVILLIVGFTVLFIIVNTIRLAVLARAEEIEIMRLVGASDAFIRWPFVFEGALVGLLGALITLGIFVAASQPLGEFMYDFFRVLPIQFGALLVRDLGILVVATGLGLGVLGSWLSVRSYLIR